MELTHQEACQKLFALQQVKTVSRISNIFNNAAFASAISKLSSIRLLSELLELNARARDSLLCIGGWEWRYIC